MFNHLQHSSTKVWHSRRHQDQTWWPAWNEHTMSSSSTDMGWSDAGELQSSRPALQREAVLTEALLAKCFSHIYPYPAIDDDMPRGLQGVYLVDSLGWKVWTLEVRPALVLLWCNVPFTGALPVAAPQQVWFGRGCMGTRCWRGLFHRHGRCSWGQKHTSSIDDVRILGVWPLCRAQDTLLRGFHAHGSFVWRQWCTWISEGKLGNAGGGGQVFVLCPQGGTWSLLRCSLLTFICEEAAPWANWWHQSRPLGEGTLLFKIDLPALAKTQFAKAAPPNSLAWRPAVLCNVRTVQLWLQLCDFFPSVKWKLKNQLL